MMASRVTLWGSMFSTENAHRHSSREMQIVVKGQARFWACSSDCTCLLILNKGREAWSRFNKKQEGPSESKQVRRGT